MVMLTGDNNDNELIGGPGPDTLTGLGGNDDFYGGAGDDLNFGGDGTDTFWSDQGNDTFDGGGQSSDIYSDRVDYRFDPAGVSVNLTSGVATDGWGGTDTLINIETVVGSEFKDKLIGSDSNKVEVFIGEGGADKIDGRGGPDYIWYGRAKSGVVVDLQKGTAKGGGGNDTLKNIEGVTGTSFSDKLYGDGKSNWFSLDTTGDKGTPNWNKGGKDYVDGRGGKDGVFFDFEKGGVVADLKSGKVKDGSGKTDQLKSIEMLAGSPFDDILKGNNKNNVLEGKDGNDKIVARKGKDVVDGGAGDDVFIFKKKEDFNTIKDFTQGDDRIHLKNFKFSNEAAALSKFSAAADGHAVFSHKGTIIDLVGVNLADLDGSDLIV